LDSTNTDKDPYTCQSGTSEHPGININKSLSLIGYGSSLPQIRCPEGKGLIFTGSRNAKEMAVTLSGLFFNESSVRVQDFSVEIVDCKFKGIRQGLQFVKSTNMASIIEIANSTFSRNHECISVVVNNTKNPPQNIQVAFKLTDSSLDGNVLSDDGGCISFAEMPYSNLSVSCDIILENVTFSRNKFSSKGLVFSNMDNGNQNIHFQNVKFTDNIPLSARNDLKVADYSECIVHSKHVNIAINSSNSTSQSARLLSVSASKISVQIINSSFVGHRIVGNGGVISLRGTELCMLNVSNSSFVNTTAAYGGAINVECTNVDSVSFRDNNFTGNTARNRGGGAVYIYSPGLDLDDNEEVTNNKTKIDYTIQGEQLLKTDIARCNFMNSLGSAVYISALKILVHLRHSTFTNCFANKGGGVFIQSGSISPKRKYSSGDMDLFLVVESSNFTDCRAGMFGGSLFVSCETEMLISITKSHFLSNSAIFGFGGALWAEIRTNQDWKRNTSKITIGHSTLKNNRARQGGALFLMLKTHSILTLQEVLMESNGAVERFGGVAVIYNCNLKIRNSRFLNNFAGSYGGVFWMAGEVRALDVADSLFDSNSAWGFTGGAILIQTGSAFLSILIVSSTFNNCSAAFRAGAVYVENEGSLSLIIKGCRFTNNQASNGDGGALYILLAPVSPNTRNTGSQDNTSWHYKNGLFLIEDTTFERNTALASGAVYLSNGRATFKNCFFIDNFARLQAGHIYLTGGSVSLTLRDSLFCQRMNK